MIYQIYPRSFQDADADGIGDLPGIASRLDHVAGLGVDAIWLSPIHPSPLADFGYDVADFTAVDPTLGTLADFERLRDAAHARGLRLLMDLIPCHTSIEHPWFRTHPDRYIWAPGDGPPNNWVASFGGSAWSRDERTGRWYLHSFFPEQPDLDWRNPAVLRRDRRRRAALVGARRRRLPPRRARPAAQGRVPARRPARPRPAAAARAPRPGPARPASLQPTSRTSAGRWRRCARRSASTSWSARCTSRPPRSARTSSISTWRSASSSSTRPCIPAACGR